MTSTIAEAWLLAGAMLLGCSSRAAPPVSDPVSRACSAQAKAYCERLLSCTPTFASLFYSDGDDCNATVQQRCETFAAMPGVSVDETRVSGCSSNVSAMSCGDFLSASARGDVSPFACVLSGSRGTGEACFEDWQCAAGVCVIAAGTCGTCEVPLAVGASCTSGEAVCGPRDAAYCDLGGTGTCRAYGGVGAACEPQQDPWCRPGLSCRPSTPHVCEAPPTTPNAPCDGLGADECSFPAGLTCAGSCEPIRPTGLGESCGDLLHVCRAGTYCSARGICEAAPVVGESCGGSSHGLYLCQLPALCVNGTCVDPASITCR